MKKWLIGALCLPMWLSAQHQIGWRTDPYAGINSTFVNPALSAQTPYRWDVNLAEGSAFLTNNYVYFLDTGLPGLYRASQDPKTEFFFRGDLPQDAVRDKLMIYDYVDDTRARYAQVETSILGPSFSLEVVPGTRVGLFTRWRGMATTRDVDTDFSFYRWRDFPDLEDIPIDPFRMAAASWAEAGLHLAQQIYTPGGRLTLGFNARYLWGQRAAYFINEQAFDIAKLPDNQGVQGTDFQLTAGFSNNLTEQDNYSSSPGRGWGVDLGVTYEFGEADGYYQGMIGASLLDLGRLNFADGQEHLFTNEVLTTVLTDQYENFSEDMAVEEAIRQLSQDVYADSLGSRTADEMHLALPTTFGLQFKYAFDEHISVHAQYLGSLSMTDGPGLERMGMLAVTPRYDRYWWGVGLPVSYYAFDQLRVGLAVRLGPFFFGTDQVGSLFNTSQLQGGDFYAGIKLFPFWKSEGGERSSGRRSRPRDGSELPCYKF